MIFDYSLPLEASSYILFFSSHSSLLKTLTSPDFVKVRPLYDVEIGMIL